MRAFIIASSASATWMMRAPSGISIAGEAGRVAGAVEVLVVVADRRHGIGEEAEPARRSRRPRRHGSASRPAPRARARRASSGSRRERRSCRCRGRAPRGRASRAPAARGRSRRRSRARSHAHAGSDRRCRRRARRPSPRGPRVASVERFRSSRFASSSETFCRWIVSAASCSRSALSPVWRSCDACVARISTSGTRKTASA